jgi:RNA polymerase sigma factor (sigma-70 family)
MSTGTPPSTQRTLESILVDDAWRAKLVGFARSRFGIPSDDAQDLLQETALELLRQRDYVRSPEGFVVAVFRSRCVRFISNSRAKRAVFCEAAANEDNFPSSPSLDHADRRLALREALSNVSSACRRLLCAYYVEGESLRVAAARLALAYSSASKTINRCLKRLRRCLR